MNEADCVVFVVDDDAQIRDALTNLCRSVNLPVRAFVSAQEFLDAKRPDVPSCLVLDVRFPGGGPSGLEFQRMLATNNIALPVIFITGHGDVPMSVQAMKEGAVDFIEKPFDDEVLIATIRAARALHDRMAKQREQDADIQERLRSLSERERQVMDGLLAGKSNKVIASDLGISPRTVEIYRANVMAKMQARSLSELVRMAILVGERTGAP